MNVTWFVSYLQFIGGQLVPLPVTQNIFLLNLPMFLVCGEALFDLFKENNTDITRVKFDGRAGGSPFNVAIGLARLNESTALLTGISKDMLGERLVAVLKHEGVSTRYLIQNGRRTTLSLVGIDKSGSPSYSFYGVGSADCGVKSKHVPLVGAEISGLHFGSYTTVVKPVAKAFAKLARVQKHKFISYDPNVRSTIEPRIEVWRNSVEKFARCADLLKISSEDYQALYPGEPTESRVNKWFGLGVRLVILTDGGNEIKAWTNSGINLSVTPPESNVVDTVGAGDSFQAAILKSFLEFENPKEAVKIIEQHQLRSMLNFAATAAALTCTRRGADLPGIKEIDAQQLT